MDGWIVFQLAVDAALFAIVIYYVIREGKARARERAQINAAKLTRNDIEQLETLMDELARLVLRAEKIAGRIENSAVRKADADTSAQPQRKPRPMAQSAPPKISKSEKDTYEQAAALIRKGLADDEIGRKVGLPAHEVSLIRRMAT